MTNPAAETKSIDLPANPDAAVGAGEQLSCLTQPAIYIPPVRFIAFD